MVFGFNGRYKTLHGHYRTFVDHTNLLEPKEYEIPFDSLIQDDSILIITRLAARLLNGLIYIGILWLLPLNYTLKQSSLEKRALEWRTMNYKA